ncbi:MAG TPA: hypothetical protein VK255_01415, partial [Patescibacteria group bacterium]|nr:hypothetical protein [Patescibacteria group bacterium]
IDREATGDGWNMMTGPLNVFYRKQAVYLVNPSDVNKINKARFANVYLIIPDKNQELYSSLSEQLAIYREYRMELDILDVPIGKKSEIYYRSVLLPKEKTVVTYGKIYILKSQ